MFSKRFYKTIELLTKLSSVFGATQIHFNKSTQLFSVSNEKNAIKRLKINYCFVFFWLIVSLGIVINSYHGKDINKFYVGLVFWVAFLCMVNFIVCIWFPGDFCRANNGSIHYIKFLKGN